MKVLTLEIILLAISFVIHLVLWRRQRPEKQKTALLKIFFIPLIITAAFSIFNLFLSLTLVELIYLISLHTTLTLSYLVSYTLIEADGPTFLILLSLDRSRNGLTKTQLESVVTDDLFIKHRLDGLVSDKLVFEIHDKYKLTSKGERTLLLFTFPRRLMGLSKRAG